MKNFVFIINPISGKGIGKSIDPIIREFFKDKMDQIKIIFSEFPGHAREIALEELNNSPDVIVACGGDGTINEIASVLVNSNIVLGVIPVGSGNGLASNLNIPNNILLAIKNIWENNIFPMDVGKFNDRFFFSNVGLGIDAKVIKEYESRKTRNFIGYFNAAIKSLAEYKPIALKIEVDDRVFDEQNYFFALCSNTNIAGYNVSFTPEASLDDGKLDVLLVENLSFLKEVAFSYHVIKRTLDEFHKAKLFQVEHINFKFNKAGILAQIDGESVVLDSDEVDVIIIPKALKVIVPSKSMV